MQQPAGSHGRIDEAMENRGLFQAQLVVGEQAVERPCLPWQGTAQQQQQKQDGTPGPTQMLVPPVPVFLEAPSVQVEPMVPDLRDLKRVMPAAGSSDEHSQPPPEPVAKLRRISSKDSKEWTVAGVTVLLDAYEERYEKLHRGNFSSKDWEFVAAFVNERCKDHGKKTKIQCKNKIENLKKKFRLEESRSGGGSGKPSWFWYERMEGLVGPVQKKLTPDSKDTVQRHHQHVQPGIPGGIDAGDPGPSSGKPSSEYVADLEEEERLELPEASRALALDNASDSARADGAAGKSWDRQARDEDAANASTRPQHSGAESDREAGPSNGSTGVHKRSRQEAGERRNQKCPAAELASSFSRFVDAMVKIESEKMDLLKQLLLSQTQRPRNPP